MFGVDCGCFCCLWIPLERIVGTKMWHETTRGGWDWELNFSLEQTTKRVSVEENQKLLVKGEGLHLSAKCHLPREDKVLIFRGLII